MSLLERLRKAIHWEPTPKPDRKLLPPLYSHFKPFRLPLILTVLAMLIGTLGYIAIDNFTLIDALYQAGITFTTVGFGEMAPISEAGRIFTVTLIIAGFAVFSSAVGIIISVISKGDIANSIKARGMLYRIARLKNHFVVCYHNDYTVQVTKQFRENHIPFVVIDPSKNIEAIAKEYKYPYFLQDDPHTENAMLKAFLSSAKGLVTLSNSIADNIAVIASVRLYEKEHRVPKSYYVISTAETLTDVDKLKKLGANSVVSPTKITAQRVSAMAIHPEMENLLEEFINRSDTPLNLEEILVPKYSWMVLKKIRETHIRDITNVSIVGITKKDGKFAPMPGAEVLITSEAKLLVVGTQKGINIAKEIVKKRKKPEELKYV